MSSNIQYAPFSSSVDPGFWQVLTQKKLHEFGLDESHQQVNGFFSNGNAQGIPPQLTIDYSAFKSDWKPPARSFPILGTICNTNTVEKFKDIDKKELLCGLGCEIWEDITSGKVLDQPERLCRFILLTFADLKKYHYYYWFAFPALKFPNKSTYLQAPACLQDVVPKDKLESLMSAYDTFQSSRSNYASFFVVTEQSTGVEIKNFNELDNAVSGEENWMVGVCDPSSVPGYPGWPVRNLITFLTYRYTNKLKSIKVLMVRDRTHNAIREFGQSLVATVDIPQVDKESIPSPECVGWEKNEKSKLGPRMVNLSTSMDPVRLAESAVDLNLRLMRWRLLPDLDLDGIGSTRCLVLGSGTLGCNVARLLMSWGMRHITMVDNSRVSYSNPVRQTLFTFQDCMDGGKPKAQAAADSLRNIFPGMQSEGLSLSIPMPGHAITDSTLEQTKKDVKKLESLVDSHDALFLLMDTRESRWLPSLLAAAKRKIVINAALGFDTFLVLRHGVKAEDETASCCPESSGIPMGRIKGSQLGCYFCNDVVAPGNSTRDRTLDQQCTVTRPGLSMVASALAVELLVSVLQHPLRGEAAAETSANDDHLSTEAECSLGIVPHQIRGFLARFHQILPASQAFNMCTACSPVVINKYKTEGFDFLLRAFNEPGFLEDLTGLTAMQDATLDAEVWGLSDDEDFSDGPGSMDMET